MRWPSALTITALLTAVCYAALGFASRIWERPPLWAFFAPIGLAGASATWAAFRGNPPSGSMGYRRVVGWSAVFFLIGLAGRPLYEDDFYRYLWDGRQFVETGDPYRQAPADYGGPPLSPRFREILDHVGFPAIPTIYGPTCQLAFALAYRIAPGEVWPLKGIWFGCHLLLIAVLIRLGVSPARLILYAWSPLLFKEIFLTAHTDILTACFLFLALDCAVRRWPWMAGVSLALAVGAKVPALLMAPLILKLSRWRGAAAAAATLAILYLPFARSRGDSAGLIAFLNGWEFNSLGYALLSPAVGSMTAKALGYGAAAAAALAAWTFAAPDPRRFPAHAVWGAFYFFSPVVNPWYLVSWLPWVTLQPAGWAIAACLAPLLSYATGNNMPASGLTGYNHPWWVRPLEVSAVAAAFMAPFLHEKLRGNNGWRSRIPGNTPEDIS